MPSELAPVFLDTSAQFKRIYGPESLQRQIHDLLEERGSFGSSTHVWNEFQAVVDALYGQVAELLRRQPSPGRRREPMDLWKAVVQDLRPHTPGGPGLISVAGAQMQEAFHGETVTPRAAANWADSMRCMMRAQFFVFPGRVLREMDLADRSTCCCWKSSGLTPCPAAPDDRCRLRQITIDAKKRFLASIETIANSPVSESQAVAKLMPRLSAAADMDLLRLVGSRPNLFGDAVIFWEVPEDWDLLTAEPVFGYLRDAHRKDMGVLRIRGAFKPKHRHAILEAGGKPGIEVVLVDYTSLSATVLTPLGSYRNRTPVVLTSQELGAPRHGTITESASGPDGTTLRLRFPAWPRPVRTKN